MSGQSPLPSTTVLPHPPQTLCPLSPRTGTGFFINSFLIMTLVYLNIWVILVLALTNSMLVVDPYTLTVINALTGQAVAVSVNQAVQLGMLSIIVFAVELLLEYGIVKMLGTLLVQFVQGAWKGVPGVGGDAWTAEHVPGPEGGCAVPGGGAVATTAPALRSSGRARAPTTS